jgi:ankyrin repeat protein
VERGADVNGKNIDGKTPLHKACEYVKDAIVSLLLEKAGDVNAKSNYGWTPLHDASSKGHEAVVSLLLENGADVNAKNKDGNTPLHLASWKEHEAVVSILLEKGANVDAKNDIGYTPLHDACMCRKDAIISLLLEKGADQTITNNKGETPLQKLINYDLLSASIIGDLKKVKQAIENGANVHAKEFRGSPPLHSASRRGHDAVVSFLLENGADVNETAMLSFFWRYATSCGLLRRT